MTSFKLFHSFEMEELKKFCEQNNHQFESALRIILREQRIRNYPYLENK